MEQLTKEEINNLLIMLDRVPTTGTKEAFVLVNLTHKLNLLMKEQTEPKEKPKK